MHTTLKVMGNHHLSAELLIRSYGKLSDTVSALQPSVMIGLENNGTKFTQRNYLAKTDLNSSVFFRENPVFMSIQVVVISSGITTTWTAENYGAVQVHFDEVALLCQ